MAELERLLAIDTVDVNARDANGETALLEAAGGGSCPAIKVSVCNRAPARSILI